MWNICAQRITEVRGGTKNQRSGYSTSVGLPAFVLDPNGCQIAKGDFDLAYTIAAEVLGAENSAAYTEYCGVRIYRLPKPRRGPDREVFVSISIAEV